VSLVRSSFLPSRRRFLGGGAVAIALPAFESLLGKAAHAQAPRRRLVTVFLPVGMLMDEWTPSSTGPLQLSGMTTPFENVKKKLLILSHLSNLSGKNRPGDHAAGTGAVFNCAKPAKGDGADIRAGVSVDQVAAKHLRQYTPLPSLQLGVIKGRRTGICEAGYSCVVENTISWADEKTPLPPAHNPAAVFDQLFKGFDPTESAAARMARMAGKRRLLDYVREDAKLLSAKLGRSDAVKLEQLISGIDDIDKRLQTSSAPGTRCGSLARPADSATPDYNVNAEIMNSITVAAFQCDLTRVISNQIAPSYPAINYNHIGVSAGHHSCSHFNSEGEKSQYRKCQQWHVKVVADLLTKLDAVPEGAGTLLDSTFVVQSSDVGNPRSHDHAHLPVLVAGGGGVFKMGRHISYPETPIANLFIAVLNGLGVPATTFGADGTRPLGDLT
jgi:hypothetical protein